MTIDEIKKLFSQTIFWNYLDDWPGDEHRLAESDLEILEQSPDEDGGREVLIRYEGGETTVGVALMWPAKPAQDAENHTTDADVKFVAQLPVIMPVLLTELDRQRDAAAKLQAIQIEIIGAMADSGVAMLEKNPCGPGETATAIRRLAYERNLLAMLAADTPQFDNPLAAMAAKALRDRVLKAMERP